MSRLISVSHSASLLLLAILLAGISARAQEPESEPQQAESDANEQASESVDEEQSSTEESASRRIKGRILPAPFVITEPAIGKGLGLGFIYFHGRDAIDRPRIQSANAVGNTARRSKPPPTATAAGGFYTDNETAGVAIAHSRTMADDKYRMVGIMASMDINATYYQGDSGFNFGLDAKALYGRGQRRMGDSNLFLGMSVGWMDGSIGFDLGPDSILPDGILDSDFTNAGIALSAIHDSRDESMMPGSGHLYDLTVWRFDDTFGSDFDYTNTRLKLLWFNELTESFHLGFRLDIANSSGDAPFFMIPYVPLRGIPALRYQADTAGAFEIEGRYDISPRWAAVAFTGAGLIDWEPDDDEADEDIYTWGAGIRFQLFTEQNVWIGLDIARGPEESNWYIQIGHPW
jgi:hypothetical protein